MTNADEEHSFSSPLYLTIYQPSPYEHIKITEGILGVQ